MNRLFNKLFLSFLVMFFCLCGRMNAQLDLEHWFPPFLQSSVGNTTVTSVRLFLSTDKVQPFKVRLYNNNQLVEEFTLSKSQPIDYVVPDDSKIRATVKTNTMRPTTMGYHLAGEKSFYASIRMYGLPISEMIASKGKSALGTRFFVVNDQTILYDEEEPNGTRKFMMNYQASIMALEDNTKIKVSNFDKRLVFANGDSSDELNFTLNKGQSYIVAAIKSDNPTPNNPIPVLDDNDPNLIGAQITSDKKIVVSNGNFLSQGIGDIGQNINLDQSLPLSRIGKEYFIANGLTFADGFMEKMVMVATENNTEIFLNDESQPFKVLNEGEYYIGPGPRIKKFIGGSQPSFTNSVTKTIDTKGIYLRASKPLYVFQMIGGFQDMPARMAPDNTPRTSAMMFSYPIDKDYLPDNRQKLSNTMVIPKIDVLAGRALDNKITLKTPTGANVKVNNVAIPASDFSPIVGKPGWSYWSRFQLNGDFEVTSDKSINVDYTGGYIFSGLAGSYTGFSNDPFIIRNGNCIQENVILTLNNTDFAHFQWQLNGVDIPSANSSAYTPISPGSYTCVLSYMDFKFTTAAETVVDCPYTVSTRNLGTKCPDFTLQPEFSAPNQSLPIVSVEIMTQPLKGNVTFDGSVFNIVPLADFSGPDRFVYKITASTGFYEVVKVQYTVLPRPLGDIKEFIVPGATVEPNFYFNLISAINNSNGEDFTFFETEADALAGQNSITDPLNYSVLEEKLIYVKIKNAAGCTAVKSFLLSIPPKPPVSVSTYNVLTPNADGFNDVWDYSALEPLNLLDLKIYDRKGILVFAHQKNGKFQWNGKNQTNHPVPSGTYWVVYQYTDSGGELIQKHQWILVKNS